MVIIKFNYYYYYLKNLNLIFKTTPTKSATHLTPVYSRPAVHETDLKFSADNLESPSQVGPSERVSGRGNVQYFYLIVQTSSTTTTTTSRMYRETVVAVLSLLVTVTADCMIEADAESNVLAGRIVGNWTFNADMTRMMGGDEQTLGLVGTMVVSMTDEPEVLEELPDDNCKFLMENDLKIYVAGTLRFFHIE